MEMLESLGDSVNCCCPAAALLLLLLRSRPQNVTLDVGMLKAHRRWACSATDLWMCLQGAVAYTEVVSNLMTQGGWSGLWGLILKVSEPIIFHFLTIWDGKMTELFLTYLIIRMKFLLECSKNSLTHWCYAKERHRLRKNIWNMQIWQCSLTAIKRFLNIK